MGPAKTRHHIFKLHKGAVSNEGAELGIKQVLRSLHGG